MKTWVVLVKTVSNTVLAKKWCNNPRKLKFNHFQFQVHRDFRSTRVYKFSGWNFQLRNGCCLVTCTTFSHFPRACISNLSSCHSFGFSYPLTIDSSKLLCEIHKSKKHVAAVWINSELRCLFTDMRFLVLKNATHGFAEPCVIDIKIGKQTWEPGASDEKKENEQVTFPFSRKANHKIVFQN